MERRHRLIKLLKRSLHLEESIRQVLCISIHQRRSSLLSELLDDEGRLLQDIVDAIADIQRHDLMVQHDRVRWEPHEVRDVRMKQLESALREGVNGPNRG